MTTPELKSTEPETIEVEIGLNKINEEIPKEKVVILEFDDDEIKTNYVTIYRCSLINNMIQNFNHEELSEIRIPIGTGIVSLEVMKKIMVYLDNYSDKEENEVSQFDFSFDDFEKSFLDMTEEYIKTVVEAAHYLGAKTLTNLLCKQIAEIIRGKTPEEIDAIFEPIKDFKDQIEVE